MHKKLSISIPDGMHQKIKAISKQHERTLSRVIQDLIEQALDGGGGQTMREPDAEYRPRPTRRPPAGSARAAGR